MKHSAIVTGGASGIGLAIAERLLDDGWPVAVLDADRAALAAAEAAFAGENAIFLAADVTDEEEVADTFDQIVDRIGLVGGLVNAAGLFKALPAEDTTAELLREMLDVNLVGAFIAAKAALERMGAALSIVNIGSVSGLRADRGRLPMARRGRCASFIAGWNTAIAVRELRRPPDRNADGARLTLPRKARSWRAARYTESPQRPLRWRSRCRAGGYINGHTLVVRLRRQRRDAGRTAGSGEMLLFASLLTVAMVAGYGRDATAGAKARRPFACRHEAPGCKHPPVVLVTSLGAASTNIKTRSPPPSRRRRRS